MRILYLITLLSLLALTAPAFAEEFHPIPLEKGQLIAFVGDSITQQNYYTRYLEFLLNVRYPDLKLRFVNVGWNGRHAGQLLDDAILQRDLLSLNPDIVMLHFGMNDGWYCNPPEQAAMSAYQYNITELIAKIKVALPSAHIILMTPTICDPDGHPYLKGYNDTLSHMAEIIKEIGEKNNCRVINLFTPMMQANIEGKEKNTQFNMFLDGVHPDPVGHWLMAAIMGREFNVTQNLVRVTLDANTGKAEQQVGAAVTDLLFDGDALNFTTSCNIVPVAMPLETRGAQVLNFVRNNRDRAILTVHGLAPNQLYGVFVHKRLIGRYRGSDLASGIEWTNVPNESSLTTRVLQLATGKYHYRWTAWRAPDTGNAEIDARDFNLEDWTELNMALNRMTARANNQEYDLIQSAKTVKWRIAPEYPIPLNNWQVLGPFSYRQFDSKYPPESNRNTALGWTPVTADSNSFLDFTPAYGNFRNSVIFARARIYVPHQATLSLSAGSFGPLKVWVEGKICISHDINRIAESGQDTGTANLRAGWNTILIRETRGQQGWGFYASAYLSGLTPDEVREIKSLLE